MLQSDSIQTTTEAGEEMVVHKHFQPTPAQIISWLPKTATPEQQDSAVQAHIHPSEIHWSERPDTLHLPGQSLGKSILDVSLPQYYKESFFSSKPYFHPEIEGGRQGVAGDPIPYSIAGDNFMTSLLLIILFITAFALSQAAGFFERQFKLFFYTQHGKTTQVTETGSEVRFQFMMCIETCLLFSLLYFFYLREDVDTFTIGQSTFIALYTAVFFLYFSSKYLLMIIVNSVFFDSKKNQQWIKSHVFLFVLLGILLLPLVLVQSFFNLSMASVLIYLILVVFLFKMLSFYKTYITFFAIGGGILQIFLYFCTLEIIPFLIGWSIVDITSDYLKINF